MGRHRRNGRHARLRGASAFQIALVIALGGIIPGGTLAAISPAPSQTEATLVSTSHGNTGLNWAQYYATGHWYAWGGTGLAYYDCSGLVYSSLGRSAGVWLPRTTYGMMGSWHLYQVSWPARGDLVFFNYGSHVEYMTAWPYTTFGAHHSGTRVGYERWYRWPSGTSFWRIG